GPAPACGRGMGREPFPCETSSKRVFSGTPSTFARAGRSVKPVKHLHAGALRVLDLRRSQTSYSVPHLGGVTRPKEGVMTRRYEIVYIFDSALDEEQVKTVLARFHSLLATPEKAEPVTQSNHWGKRTLAYPIRRRESGYYVVEQFET